PSAIISAYTSPVSQGTVPDNVRCHILASKYLPGLEPGLVITVPLTAMLLVEYAYDTHYTVYTTPAEVRCKKYEPLPAPICFQFTALDLDFDEHRSKPTRAAFADLLRSLYITDYTPNIVHETRGGARILYLIEPMTDPDKFEAHCGELLDKI